MLAILLDHTDIYMTGGNTIPYMAYVTDALIVFFVISGYLCYREEGIGVRHKLRSIVRTLLMPYFVFTSVIALVKPWVHHEPFDLLQIAATVATGQASWFIAALIVAEVIFVLSLRLTRANLWAMAAVACTGLGVSAVLSHTDYPDYWQVGNALQAVFLLYLGYLCHRFEPRMQRYLTPLTVALMALVLVGVKWYAWRHGYDMLISPIHISSYPCFLAVALLSPLVLMRLSQWLPRLKWLEWTGRTSIVYYFLSGACPTLVSMLFARIPLSHHGSYLLVLTAFVLVYLLASVLTWAIYRYIPAVTGRPGNAVK